MDNINSNLKKRKILLICGIGALVLILIGSTYAFFNYSHSRQAFVLDSGSVQARFKGGTNQISYSYAYPISDKFAIANLDKLTYIDFTVTSSISDLKEAIYYEIYLTDDDNNTLDSNYIHVYLTDDKNNRITGPLTYGTLGQTTYSNSPNGKLLYSDTVSGTFANNFRIYAWISQDYEQNEVSETFNFKVNLYAHNADAIEPVERIKTRLNINNSVTDDDGTIYLSGTNDDINFNYVWYSGKLWRITAINQDGTMKMITENQITEIYFGANSTYQDSWVQAWLNEDFKDTLYNYQNIIKENVSWNVTLDANTEPQKPESLANQNTVTGDVGLLSAYEYYQSYNKLGTEANGYLNIGYSWWTITPYSDENGWGVYSEENNLYNTLSIRALGIRPVIVLKDTIEISGGDGSRTNPYTIEGDKKVGTAEEKINERLSGEYVKFQNDIYRIVGIESDGSTKLTSINYLKDASGTIITKAFGPTVNYKNSVDSNDPTYWGAYLNTTWYDSIASPYKEMLVEGTYYLEKVAYESYKNALCSELNTTETIKECTKTENKWVGYVGLPRVGEMFASQLGKQDANSLISLTLTPFDEKYMQFISKQGNLTHGNPTTTMEHGVRPSITLNANVYITGGSGTEQSPYEIGLPTA